MNRIIQISSIILMFTTEYNHFNIISFTTMNRIVKLEILKTFIVDDIDHFIDDRNLFEVVST